MATLCTALAETEKGPARRSTATVRAQETETKIRERANWAAIRAPANGWRGKAIPVPAHLPTATVCARETETKIRERGNRLLSQSASLHRPTGARKPGPFGSPPHSPSLFHPERWLSQRTLSYPLAGARKPVYLALPFVPLLCFRQSSGFLTL